MTHIVRSGRGGAPAWTTEENLRLVSLALSGGATEADIAAAFPQRTRHACQQQYSVLRKQVKRARSGKLPRMSWGVPSGANSAGAC